MSDGYWVVSVDRTTGEASTSDLFTDRDEAWQHSVDIETPNIFTTVVPRRQGAPRRDRSETHSSHGFPMLPERNRDV